MFLDAHVHLQDIPDNERRAELLNSAGKTGVGKLICNGIRPEDWAAVEGITNRDQRVVPFFGVHPWHAGEVKAGWDIELEKLLNRRSDAGVGEIGLDKVREPVDLARQKEVFVCQIEIAKRLSRPIAIHCVRAWGDLLALLRDRKSSHIKWMMHSFHGSAEMMAEFLKLGAYISFSWKGIRGQQEDKMDLVRRVPLDRLLLETDFPYTEPGVIGQQVSAGEYIKCLHETYQIAARAKGMDEDRLQKAVWENGTAFLH